MAGYTYKQRKDRGFDFFDPNGKKITIEEYTRGTKENGEKLRYNLASRGDSQSQSIVNAQRQRNLEQTINRAKPFNQLLSESVVNNLPNIGRELGNFGRTIGAGIQQGAGAIADVAAQGGGILGELGNATNPFKTAVQKEKDAGKSLQSTEALRAFLNQQKDIEGQNIVGTRDVDENARRIATGQGTMQDVLAVGGKGLQIGADATGFVSPVGLAGSSVRNAAKFAVKDAALQGGVQGSATAAQVYGQTGDAQKALQEGIKSGAVAGVTQGAFDIAAPIASAATRRTAQTVNEARPSVIASQDPRVTGFDDQYSQLAQRFDTTADPVARREISKAMAMNRVERSNTARSIQRQVAQGGYVRVPGAGKQADNVTPPPFVEQTGLPPQVRQTRFASQTAPNSGKLSADLAERVRQSAPEYDPATNNATLDSSIKFIKDNDVDTATNDVFARLGQPNIDRQTVSDALSLATAYDLRGGDANLRIASDIYDQLSEKLTKAGQTVQAASLLNRRTPQGLIFDAQRQLRNAGVEVTPEIRKNIKQIADSTESLKGPEKDIAIAQLQREVNRNIPDELVDKVVGTWKAGLLTGIRTTTGGALSNALFRGLREVSRPGAVALDMLTSAITGKRSTALTARGNWQGTKEGFDKAAKYLRSGVDERSFSADGKYIDREINFENKALNTYVNGVFRVMGAADRPFYYSQFRNSLAEAAIVEAKNGGNTGITSKQKLVSNPHPELEIVNGRYVSPITGNPIVGIDQPKYEALKLDRKPLTGKEFDEYVSSHIENPTQEALQYATDVAEESVLGNNTFLSDLANKLRSAAEKPQNKVARFATKGAIGVLAPFTKVPSAFLSRVVDFTPIGAVKEAVTQMSNKTLNQQKLVQAISEAGTGTGLIYLGMELANNDLLTGNYPNDPTEQSRWRTEGITPNSIKIGDTYYSLNYAGPIGAIFGIGKAMTDSLKEGNSAYDSLVAGGTQLATGTLEQSFLSGISGALDAVQDPQRYAANFVRSQAGSVIPTLLNDIGNATDPVQRQANNPLEAIQGRIPGARTGLNERTDVFGETIKQANPNPLGRLVDPLRPSDRRSNPVTDELDRLKSVDQSIFPTLDKTIKAGGETVKLDPNQQKAYNDSIGQELRLIWGNIINSDEYKLLSDEDKKKSLADAQTDIQTVEKKDYLDQIGRSDLAHKIKLTERQQKYNNGTVAATLWAKESPKRAGTAGASSSSSNENSGTLEAKFLETIPKSKEEKATWLTQEVAPENRAFVDAFNNNIPEGIPKLPYTNKVAEKYADFAKRQAEGKWSDLQLEKETSKLYRDTYKDQLTDNEKFLAGLNDNDFLSAVENGNISETELANIIEMDAIQVALGGTAALGNTLRRKLGIQTIASKSSGSSGSRRSSGGRGGRRGVGFKAPSSGGFSRISSTTALQRLVSGAGKGIKAKTIKG